MIIKNAEFVTSVASAEDILDFAPEIAVVGRSNVGKSSFINFLTNNSKLAKTSSTPGRTRLINYFSINKEEFCIVDLPGYGYAKVAKTEKAKWGKLIENYLLKSSRLVNVFIIVDIRHLPSDMDIQMVNFLYHYNIPFTVIATKSDKLRKREINTHKQSIATALKMAVGNIYEISSLAKTGIEKVLDRIDQILENIQEN